MKNAFETSAVIHVKTHLNVQQNPKFKVSEQVPYVVVDVLLMDCKLGHFWVILCVYKNGTTLTSAPMLIRNFSPEPWLFLKIGNFVWGLQRSSLIVASSLISLLGAWRCAFSSRINKLSMVLTYPTSLR